MKDKIVFGMIGCGDVTERKSGPAFRKLPQTEMKWVMRRDEKKLEDYAKRHEIPYFSTEVLDMLRDPDVDAVYIATPPHMHKYYTVLAAEHKKDVYVEKPMALTSDECREMRKACEEHGVKLYVAYYRRAQKKFLQIKSLMEKGAIGEVRSFTYQYLRPVPQFDPNRPWLFQEDTSGGGILYDVGSHMIDLFLFLFGEPSMVSGKSGNLSQALSVEDVTTGFFLFENGIQGTMNITASCGIREDLLTIAGSKGALRFSIMDQAPVSLITDHGTEIFEFEEPEHSQMEMISMISDAMLGKTNVEDSGWNGLETQEILEAFKYGKEVFFRNKD